MTNREFFTSVVNGEISEDVIKFAKNEISKLDARNEKRKEESSKNKQKNYSIEDKIFNCMDVGVVYTASQIVEVLNGLWKENEIELEKTPSTSKASTLMGDLVNRGMVVTSDVKVKGNRLVKGYSRS